jgi:chromosome segregation ATPase
MCKASFIAYRVVFPGQVSWRGHFLRVKRPLFAGIMVDITLQKGERRMRLFERFGKQGRDAVDELQEVYQEMVQLHNRLEACEREWARLRDVDEQLREAEFVRHSAKAVSDKLNEVYRDVQLISEAIRTDDRETRRFVVQQVHQMESLANQTIAESKEALATEVAALKEELQKWIEESQAEWRAGVEAEWKERMSRLEEKQSQLESTMQSLQDQLREQQKKEQALDDLVTKFAQKEADWEKRLKRRGRLVMIAILVCFALSVWSLYTSLIA